MDIFNLKWSILFAVTVISYGVYLSKKYHYLAGLLFSFISINTIYTFAWPNNLYSQFPITVQNSIKGTSGIAFISMFLVVILADFIAKKKINIFLIFVALCNSIFIIYQTTQGLDYWKRVGFFDNISLSGGLIALLIPMILNIKDKKIMFSLLPIPLVAIYCCQSSVAIGVLGLTLSAYAFMSIKRKWLALLLIPLAIGIGAITDKDLFNGSTRIQNYKIQTSAFLEDEICYPQNNKTVCWNNGNVFTGYTQGTFSFWAFIAQVRHSLYIDKGKNGELIQFLHNDYLQMLFENGLIGLLLSLALASLLAFMAWGNALLFSTLIGFYGFMLFHYPIHYPLQALVGAYIAARIMLSHKEKGLKQERLYNEA